MTFEIRFRDDEIMSDNAAFYVIEGRAVDKGIGQVVLVKPDGQRYMQAVLPGAEMVAPMDCLWRMPLDALPILHAALGDKMRLRFDSPAQMRADFEHERARVDKMLDVLLQQAAPPYIAIGTEPNRG